MLPDHAIAARIKAGDLVIDPEPTLDRLQPSSIDLTLGDSYRVFTAHHRPITLDAIPDDLTVRLPVGADGLTLQPGDFVLATTAERVTIPADLCGFLHGRSTLGRLGIAIHVTAGLVDPGYCGDVTLEMCNVGPLTLTLRRGDPIGQLTFEELGTAAMRPYGHPSLASRYQGQSGTTAPRAVPAAEPSASVVELYPGGGS